MGCNKVTGCIVVHNEGSDNEITVSWYPKMDCIVPKGGNNLKRVA